MTLMSSQPETGFVSATGLSKVRIENHLAATASVGGIMVPAPTVVKPHIAKRPECLGLLQR